MGAGGLFSHLGFAELPKSYTLDLRKIEGVVRPVRTEELRVVSDRLARGDRLPDVVPNLDAGLGEWQWCRERNANSGASRYGSDRQR